MRVESLDRRKFLHKSETDFRFSAVASYSTTLVRRWNWSTVNPANDAPAPPVGNV